MSKTTLAFYGTGETSRKNALTLVKDRVGDNEVDLIVPVAAGQFNDALDAIVGWARKNDVPYTAVIDDTTADDSDLDEVVEGATQKVKVTRIGPRIVSLAEKAGADLIMLWPKDAPEDSSEFDAAYGVLESATEKGIKVFDLTDALEPIKWVDDDSAAQPEAVKEPEPDTEREPEPEPEQPKPSRRRSSARKAAQAEIKGGQTTVEEQIAEVPQQRQPDEAQADLDVPLDSAPILSSAELVSDDAQLGAAVRILFDAFSKAMWSHKPGRGRPKTGSRPGTQETDE